MKIIALCLFILLTSPLRLIFSQSGERITTGLGMKTEVEIFLEEYRHYNVKEVKIESEDIHIFNKELKEDRLAVTLGVYALGEVKIPVTLYYLDGEIIKRAELSTLVVNVEEKELKNEDIRPIKTVVEINFIQWLFTAFLIILTAVIVYIVLKNKIPQKADSKTLSIREITLKRLKELKKQNLPGQKKYKEYYEKISYYMRYYIEKQYKINALNLTGLELDNKLKIIFNRKNLNRVTKLLIKCDKIKFSPQGRKPRYMEKIWEEAFTLISDEI